MLDVVGFVWQKKVYAERGEDVNELYVTLCN